MILVRVKPSISLAIRQASEMGLIPFSMQGRNLSNKGGGGGLFIYSCYTRRISFEINSSSKEIRRVEHEFMNKHPPPPQLAF